MPVKLKKVHENGDLQATHQVTLPFTTIRTPQSNVRIYKIKAYGVKNCTEFDIGDDFCQQIGFDLADLLHANLSIRHSFDLAENLN